MNSPVFFALEWVRDEQYDIYSAHIGPFAIEATKQGSWSRELCEEARKNRW